MFRSSCRVFALDEQRDVELTVAKGKRDSGEVEEGMVRGERERESRSFIFVPLVRNSFLLLTRSASFSIRSFRLYSPRVHARGFSPRTEQRDCTQGVSRIYLGPRTSLGRRTKREQRFQPFLAHWWINLQSFHSVLKGPSLSSHIRSNARTCACVYWTFVRVVCNWTFRRGTNIPATWNINRLADKSKRIRRILFRREAILLCAYWYVRMTFFSISLQFFHWGNFAISLWPRSCARM